MTLRSLTSSGFLHIRTHLWDPFWSLLIDPPNDVYPSSHSTELELWTQAPDLPTVTIREYCRAYNQAALYGRLLRHIVY